MTGGAAHLKKCDTTPPLWAVAYTQRVHTRLLLQLHDFGVYTVKSVGSARARGCAGSNYPFLTLKERDVETGLDYFLVRYYSSTQGRFTSPDEFTGGPDELYTFAEDASSNPTFYADPLNPQSLNKYQYSYNSPLRYVDPDGHDAQQAEDDSQGPASSIAFQTPTAARVTIKVVVEVVELTGKVPPKTIPVVPIPGDPIGDPTQGGCCIADYIISPSPSAIPPQALPRDPTAAPPTKPIVALQGQSSDSPEAKSGRKQVFKIFHKRKQAIDARPRARPAQPGEKRVTRQSKNKKGMGSKSEKHKKGGRHLHDDRHNDKKKPNVHYGFPG